MPVDEKTPHLKLPLPHQENHLEDDLPRLRQSLEDLDANAEDQGVALNGLSLRATTLEARTEGLVLAQGKTAAVLEAHQAAHNPHHTPLATREQAGLVQVGEGLAVDGMGVISVSAVLPGSVLAFSGAFGGPGNRHPIPQGGTLPDMGWALCDGGSNGRGGTTPDLRGRMILGADAARPGGTTGGSETHEHSLSGAVSDTTLSVGQIASHSHQIRNNDGWQGFVNVHAGDNSVTPARWSVSEPTGSSRPHSHSLAAMSGAASTLSPWYSLAYIMRLA